MALTAVADHDLPRDLDKKNLIAVLGKIPKDAIAKLRATDAMEDLHLINFCFSDSTQ